VATIRLRNLKGLNPEVRQRIRETLRAQPPEHLGDEGLLSDPRESKSKWHNVRTMVDGITFDSKREAERYAELKVELMAGEITDLELQKPFSLVVNGILICNYIADFVYRRNGELVVEDAKGKATDVYVIKRALMRAVFGIEIVES
jgi:hypothetical protein